VDPARPWLGVKGKFPRLTTSFEAGWNFTAEPGKAQDSRRDGVLRSGRPKVDAPGRIHGSQDWEQKSPNAPTKGRVQDSNRIYNLLQYKTLTPHVGFLETWVLFCFVHGRLLGLVRGQMVRGG
jgi:hypothetical protein